jgi:hypothetical protein
MDVQYGKVAVITWKCTLEKIYYFFLTIIRKAAAEVKIDYRYSCRHRKN